MEKTFKRKIKRDQIYKLTKKNETEKTRNVRRSGGRASISHHFTQDGGLLLQEGAGALHLGLAALAALHRRLSLRHSSRRSGRLLHGRRAAYVGLDRGCHPAVQFSRGTGATVALER